MTNVSPSPLTIGRTIDESVVPAPSARTRKGQPNIVMWVLDDVGYGHLSPYGGLVDMPAMQRIAERGMLFSNAHVTPLCSPTRACLMTGRNHHTNQMPAVPRFTSGLPNQNARIPRENGFLPEILLQEGYATFCIGKWHLTSLAELNPASSRSGWPLGRGFERFYGFMAGQTSQFDPHLCLDNGVVHPVPPRGPTYHLSADLVDTGLRYVQELRAGSIEKPFFMYLAFGASHAPHHAPREWIDRYRGQFDMGWDQYRHIVQARQQEKGLLPPDSELSIRDPDVPAWDSLSPGQHKIYARFMEAFAGMTSHMDHQVGRLLDTLEAMGELDNTIFIVVSDNGASSEGGVCGAFNNQQFQGQIDQAPATLENIADIGGPNAYNHYPWGWSWAGNTPFRRWKRETYRGGCAVPFIISWPERFSSHGVRNGFLHAIDLLPTLLEVLEISAPETLAGVRQSPIEGISFAAQLDDAGSPSRHLTQYFEMMGHRAMYHDGWRAVCPWPGPSIKEGGRGWPVDLYAADLDRLERDGWELYHVAEDPAECNDLAAQEPDRLRAIVSRWWHEAGRYGVLPLLGKPFRMTPTAARPVAVHHFYPDTAPLFIEAAPNVINTHWRILATIEVPDTGSTDGMILAHGGRFGGYGLLVRNQRPLFVYNHLGIDEFVAEATAALVPGQHVIEAEFRKTGEPRPAVKLGAPGQLTLRVDGHPVAALELDMTAPVMLSFSGMFTCGYHPAEPFTLGYETPFRFGGRIQHVEMLTHDAEPIDPEMAKEAYLKCQ